MTRKLVDATKRRRRLSGRGAIRGAPPNLSNLGELASEQQDYPAALANFEEALQLFLTLGRGRGMATVLEGLATLFAQQRDAERVMMFAGAASALHQRIGAPASARAGEDRTGHPIGACARLPMVGGELGKSLEDDAAGNDRLRADCRPSTCDLTVRRQGLTTSRSLPDRASGARR